MQSVSVPFHSPLNELPTIIDGPGKYILRNGKFCTIHGIGDEVTNTTQFRAKGSIWKTQKSIGNNPEYSIWHISGRMFSHIGECSRDIVAKAQP